VPQVGFILSGDVPQVRT